MNLLCIVCVRKHKTGRTQYAHMFRSPTSPQRSAAQATACFGRAATHLGECIYMIRAGLFEGQYVSTNIIRIACSNNILVYYDGLFNTTINVASSPMLAYSTHQLTSPHRLSPSYTAHWLASLQGRNSWTPIWKYGGLACREAGVCTSAQRYVARFMQYMT